MYIVSIKTVGESCLLWLRGRIICDHFRRRKATALQYSRFVGKLISAIATVWTIRSNSNYMGDSKEILEVTSVDIVLSVTVCNVLVYFL